MQVVRRLGLEMPYRAAAAFRLAASRGKTDGRGDRRVNSVTANTLYRDRVCGIDIGKAGLVATIRVPSDNDPAWRGPGHAASAWA
jgi:hypothetical protein